MLYRIVFIVFILNFTLFATESNNSGSEEKSYLLIINGLKHLDKEELAKRLGAKEHSMFHLLDSKEILPQEFVDGIETTLKGYLESKGYFDAKFSINKERDKITITIKEGKPIRVISIEKVTDINLENVIDWKKNDIFAAERFEKIKDKINNILLEKGYCRAKVTAKAYVDLLKHSAKLLYKIKKGNICYFAKPEIIHKPKDIEEKVVLSRLKYYQNDRYNIHKIEESYKSLNSLGVFANIQIKDNLNDGNTTLVKTKISLDKKEKLRHYMVSIGYDTDVGLRVKGAWEKRDFLNNAKKFQIKSEVSKKYKTLESTFFIPAFFAYNNIYSDLYITAGVSKERRDAYKEKKLFINSYLERYYENFIFQKGIGLEILNINLLKDYPSKIGGRFNLFYPYFNVNYDTRDSKIDPKNGFYANLYGEFGVSNRGDAVTYVKYLLELRAIKTINDITFSAVGKVGAIHELSGNLPASKLFYGGGLFSNRAYGKNKIGYLLSDRSFSQLGGKSYLNLQLESNFKLYKKFYGALFFDSTIISPNEYQFSGARIDTAGIGFRYKTPIGPVKLDIGFNLHKPKDYAISIMLGQSF